MRYRALFYRSKHVLKSHPYVYAAHCRCPVITASSRKSFHSTATVRGRHSSRNLSSAASSDSPNPPEESEDGKLKSRGRPKRTSTQEKTNEGATLPPNLDILWTPDAEHTPQPNALPPPWILQDALDALNLVLSPSMQHKATYNTQGGLPVEPTIALHCPIEGGDYVIDESVRELARRTDSEVIVLDTVEIAAGEWGAFGKAAAAIELPENPLHHFQSPGSSSNSQPPAEEESDEDEDEEPPHLIVNASQPILSLSASSSSSPRPMRVNMTLSRRAPPSRAKIFFDELINIPSPSRDSSRQRPRIIYIRDYPLLSSMSSSWFPSLLASVRSYRQGPLPRPASPIETPVAIILGSTPSLVPPRSSSPSISSGPASALLNLLLNRRSIAMPPRRHEYKATDPWDESELAQKARERRLQERLRRWERGDPQFFDELPEPPSALDQASESNAPEQGIMIMGGAQPFPPGLISAQPNESLEGERSVRLTVLVPQSRLTLMEKQFRITRRRHINELIFRMAVGSVGGVLTDNLMISKLFSEEAQQEIVLEKEPEAEVEVEEQPVSTALVPGSEQQLTDKGDMWEEMGQRVESWLRVKQIAHRTVGRISASLRSNPIYQTMAVSLEPLPISWSAVKDTWVLHRNFRKNKRVWIEEFSNKPANGDDAKESGGEKAEQAADEVIERVKRDPSLDTHESRLLGCIVDPSTMTTSFDQVHLPTHTIDSVRTIVSLPLLHPDAFNHGILKQHAMTGALLFGPPGTGKTLVVRALAKESGSRMLLIKPSDVMDMYVGEGEKLVRSVFSLARRLSPCVVFLDELDALLGARVSGRETGSALAHRAIITEFMQEMDGLKTSARDMNVVVIGATNRPFDLDDAVLRRLPRRLLVDLPGEKERHEILKILLRDETLSAEVVLADLAKRTESFSGSDLKHLCVAAALDAVKEKVALPWKVSQSDETKSEASSTISDASPHPRVLSVANFAKALKEITPSASESLGTLSDLRKWNDQFGEGARNRKRKMWGDRFGFTITSPERTEGKVDVNSQAG